MTNSFIKAKAVSANSEFVCVKMPYNGNVKLKIGSESDFAVYDNGKFVFCGAYSAPYGKCAYDVFDFNGKGELTLLFCKFPHGSSIYKNQKQLIVYELTDENGNVVSYSDEGVIAFACESIVYPDYAITAQIGWSFEYDLSLKSTRNIKFIRSENNAELIERPVKKCRFYKKTGLMLKKGNFSACGGKTPAEIAENMKILHVGESGDLFKNGSFAVYDLCEETTGQISFDILSDHDTEIIIGYAEDFAEKVHSSINGRNFAFRYRLKKGENEFVQPFGRMGGRYLVLLAFGEMKIKSIGVYEAGYPVSKKNHVFKNSLDQKIYDTAVRTNYLCMHSHYEDCPWREQAFYGMDSALQMKYAFSFFDDATFAKENLRLFYSTQRSDGLFELCAPSEIGTTIPSFSLFAAMALCDYYDFTKDKDFVFESKNIIEKLIRSFAERLDNGLIARFFKKEYWNFYEWKTNLDGGDIFRKEDQIPIIDLPLNALFAMALFKIGKMFDELKIENDYIKTAERIRKELDDKFYDESKKAFYCFLYRGEKSEHNELCEVLMLAINSIHSAVAAKNVIRERFDPVTIAFFGIKADALINYDSDCKKFVLNKIRKVFGKMIKDGATSFYETEKGKADFGTAGSLCHAWASVPAYLYVKHYLKDIAENN